MCIKYVCKCLFLNTLASVALKREAFVSVSAMLFCSVLIINEAQMIYYVFSFCHFAFFFSHALILVQTNQIVFVNRTEVRIVFYYILCLLYYI